MKSWVVHEFDHFLHLFLEDALRDSPPRLRECVLRSTLMGGSRIRPELTHASWSSLVRRHQEYETLSSRSPLLGAAVECLHAFSLIHDDLPCLDNDDFRRGLPTAHKVYGEALALLAGDLLQSLSLEAVGRFSKFATQEKCPVVAEGLLSFSQLLGTKGLIIGQARELESTHLQPHTDLLLQIFREKTGALFALSLSLPWTLYFPESQEAELLRTLGFHLGELYQIADDLEDQGHSSRSTPWHLLELLPIREERDAWVESIKKPLLLLEALNQFPELQAPLDKILRKLHLHETR